jgi:hypothetical protein
MPDSLGRCLSRTSAATARVVPDPKLTPEDAFETTVQDPFGICDRHIGSASAVRIADPVVPFLHRLVETKVCPGKVPELVLHSLEPRFPVFRVGDATAPSAVPLERKPREPLTSLPARKTPLIYYNKSNIHVYCKLGDHL